MEYYETYIKEQSVRPIKKTTKQKRQDRLNRWLSKMAKLPNISVLQVELLRRKEQAKINKL